jgi:peptide subunit release factor RF-3
MSGYTKSDMYKMYVRGVFDGMANYDPEHPDTLTAANDLAEQDFESRLAQIKAEKAVQPKRGEDAEDKALEAAGYPREGIMFNGYRVKLIDFESDPEEPNGK